MTEYRVRFGRGERVTETEEIYSIPYKNGKDDGIIKPLPFCWECSQGGEKALPHMCSRVQPTCPDCGEGILCWAELGYAPWHRICNFCGSHWDLHPGTEGYIQRARFYTKES